MKEISCILDAEKHLDGVRAVVFDLDDTLYSEKDYIRSGFAAASPENAAALWAAFSAGKPAFDTVVPTEKAAALERYRSHFPNISLYDGVAEMLTRIRKSGKKLGLLTDGRPEGQRQKIIALGLRELFDEIIITDELGGAMYRKPCDRAFCLMRERLDVPYTEMIYIGDNPAKDFIAPEKLGMKTLYFKNPDGLYSG